MLYIISGVAKSGKTLIAKKLLEKYQISYFSTDYLMMSLSLAAPKLGVNHEEDDFIVANAMEPYLYFMIKTMVENNIDYCLEGVHFNPLFAKKILTDFKGRIKFLYLGFSDVSWEDKLDELNRYRLSLENYWFKHYSYDQMVELVKSLIEVSSTIKKKSSDLSIPYLDVYNIQDQSENIIDKLMNS
jgi:putative acetyltransferase